MENQVANNTKNIENISNNLYSVQTNIENNCLGLQEQIVEISKSVKKLEKNLDKKKPDFRFLCTSCTSQPIDYGTFRSFYDNIISNYLPDKINPIHPFSYEFFSPQNVEYAYEYINNNYLPDAALLLGDNIYTDFGFFEGKIDDTIHLLPHTPFIKDHILFTFDYTFNNLVIDYQDKVVGIGRHNYIINTELHIKLEYSDNLTLELEGDTVDSDGFFTGVITLKCHQNFAERVNIHVKINDEILSFEKLQFGNLKRKTYTPEERIKYSEDFIKNYFNNDNPYWGDKHPIIGGLYDGEEGNYAYLEDPRYQTDETFVVAELSYQGWSEKFNFNFNEFSKKQHQDLFAVTKSKKNGYGLPSDIDPIVDGDTITLGTGEIKFGGLTYQQIKDLDEYKNLSDNDFTYYIDIPYLSNDLDAKKVILGYEEYFTYELSYKGEITSRLFDTFNNQIIKYCSLVKNHRTINNLIPNKNQNKLRDVIKNKTYFTVDDHDLGPNNWGNNYCGKYIGLELIKQLDSLDNYPVYSYKGDKSYNKNGTGYYYNKIFNIDMGRNLTYVADNNNNFVIHYICLDDQFNRTPGEVLNKSKTVLNNLDEASYFGDVQMNWFKRTVLSVRADLILVASGSPLFRRHYGSDDSTNFNPKGRDELLDIISDLDITNIVFIGGDSHETNVSLNYWLGPERPMYTITVGSGTHGGNSRAVSNDSVYKIEKFDPYDENPNKELSYLDNLQSPSPQNCFVYLDLLLPKYDNNLNYPLLRVTNVNMISGLNKIQEFEPFYIEIKKITGHNYLLNNNRYKIDYDGLRFTPFDTKSPTITCVLSSSYVLDNGNTVNDELQLNGIKFIDCDFLLESEFDYNLYKDNGKENEIVQNINKNNTLVLISNTKNENIISSTLNTYIGFLLSNSNTNIYNLIPPVGQTAKYKLYLSFGEYKLKLYEVEKRIEMIVDGFTLLEFFGLASSPYVSDNKIIHNKYLDENKIFNALPENDGHYIYNNDEKLTTKEYSLARYGAYPIDLKNNKWTQNNYDMTEYNSLEDITVLGENTTYKITDDVLAFYPFNRSIYWSKEFASKRLSKLVAIDDNDKHIPLEASDKKLQDYGGKKYGILVKQNIPGLDENNFVEKRKDPYYNYYTQNFWLLKYNPIQKFSENIFSNILQISYDNVLETTISNNTDLYQIVDLYINPKGSDEYINAYFYFSIGVYYQDYRLEIGNQSERYFTTGWANLSSKTRQLMYNTTDVNENTIQNYLDSLNGKPIKHNITFELNFKLGTVTGYYTNKNTNESILIGGGIATEIVEFIENNRLTTDDILISIENGTYEQSTGLPSEVCTVQNVEIVEHII